MRYAVGKLLLAGLAGITATGASAQITDVRASSTGTIYLRPTGAALPDFNGTVLEEYRADNRGRGAGFDATTFITGNSIYFENGTEAAGARNRSRAITTVDIDFVNGSTAPQLASLKSVIFPSSFGFYVSDFVGCTGATLKTCDQATANFGFSGFTKITSVAANAGIAGTSFTFEVLSDGVVARSISGSIKVIRDAQGNIAFEENFGTGQDALSSVLTNFRRVANDDFAYVYTWDEGPFEAFFASAVQPGEDRTISYRITTETFSYSQALFGERVARNEIIAFSGFADPLGRGGSISESLDGIDPITGQYSLPAITGVNFQPYRLLFPRYVNGQIIMAAGETGILPIELTGGAVPEPATWGLMIAGFGLVGAAVRRRRAALNA